VKRQPPKKDAAAELTPAEAQVIADGICADMHWDSQSLARFVLLLRWLANHADDTERENVYINTEATAAPFVDGVGEAVEAEMRRQLEAVRRKGGAK
jgi:hypothetical protein